MGQPMYSTLVPFSSTEWFRIFDLYRYIHIRILTNGQFVEEATVHPSLHKTFERCQTPSFIQIVVYFLNFLSALWRRW